MEREDLLKSPEYWMTKAQFDLYACAEDYMRSHNMNRTQLAEYLGVSKSYVSQLLNGDFDHKLSKLVELALAFGVVPQIEFKPVSDAIKEDYFHYSKPKWSLVTYNAVQNSSCIKFAENESFETISYNVNTKVA